MKRVMTCIVCPLGCTLEIDITPDGQVKKVEGNICKRGAKYGEEECTHPQRTLTTTLRCEDGSMISVKTDRTIPKEQMLEAMRQINGYIVKPPVRVGDVLIRDVFGSNVVATKNQL